LIGTALLLIAVIGSGIAAQTLSPNDTGLELLEHAAATGAALLAIILAAAPYRAPISILLSVARTPCTPIIS
jgi:glycerol uptake facilitator-like aquaporin